MRKTKVINIFGEPGAGKSKAAAYLYAKMKFDGVDVELCREYAKDVFYAEENVSQEMIYHRQKERLDMLVGKVDVIITDSPLPLSILYVDGNYQKKAEYEKRVMTDYLQYINLNFVAVRRDKYDPRGRWETEDEAKAIRNNMIFLLDKYHLPRDLFYSDQRGCDDLYEILKKSVK